MYANPYAYGTQLGNGYFARPGQAGISTTARRAYAGIARPTAPIAMTPYVGYPTVQESEEADWTTYAIAGIAIAAVAGGVWYLKRTGRI